MRTPPKAPLIPLFALLAVTAVGAQAFQGSTADHNKATSPNPPSAKTCHAQGHQSGFHPRKCPDNIAELCADNAPRQIDVDEFLANKDADTAVCVRQGSNQVVTWYADPQGAHKGFKVLSVKEKRWLFGKDGSPFDDGDKPFPYTPDASGHATSAHLDKNTDHVKPLDPGKCYEFKSQIQDSDGTCYDPHIYVGCDNCVRSHGDNDDKAQSSKHKK